MTQARLIPLPFFKDPRTKFEIETNMRSMRTRLEAAMAAKHAELEMRRALGR